MLWRSGRASTRTGRRPASAALRKRVNGGAGTGGREVRCSLNAHAPFSRGLLTGRQSFTDTPPHHIHTHSSIASRGASSLCRALDSLRG